MYLSTRRAGFRRTWLHLEEMAAARWTNDSNKRVQVHRFNAVSLSTISSRPPQRQRKRVVKLDEDQDSDTVDSILPPSSAIVADAPFPASQPFLELRKMSATGRIQIWQAFLAGNVGTVKWGVENGKLQQVTRTIIEGKQKRNAEEQLKLELRSIANKKMLKDGYQLAKGTLNGSSEESAGLQEGEKHLKKSKRKVANTKKNGSVSTDTSKVSVEGMQQESTLELPPLPMLAKVWTSDQQASLMQTDCKLFVQPKLDGLRCIANVETGKLWSRARKPFEGLDHISASILSLPYRGELISRGIRFVDGEIYHHGLDFQEITSIARRTSVNPHENSEVLSYYIFDACSETLTFEQRWPQVETLAKAEGETNRSIVPCITEVRDKQTFDAASELKLWTSRGYEGLMIRLSPATMAKEGGYRSGMRSSCLLKYKQFQQEEFPVVEFQRHRELETLGSVLLSLPNGQTFSATPANSAKTKLEMWQNRDEYRKPGWIATVQYQDLSRTGIPRFPVLLGFRYADDR